MFFGEYEGGELIVEEPTGDRVLSEKTFGINFVDATTTTTICRMSATNSALLPILKNESE